MTRNRGRIAGPGAESGVSVSVDLDARAFDRCEATFRDAPTLPPPNVSAQSSHVAEWGEGWVREVCLSIGCGLVVLGLIGVLQSAEGASALRVWRGPADLGAQIRTGRGTTDARDPS